MLGITDDLVGEGVEDMGKILVVVVVDEVVMLPNVVELTVIVGITLSTLELFMLEPKELL